MALPAGSVANTARPAPGRKKISTRTAFARVKQATATSMDGLLILLGSFIARDWVLRRTDLGIGTRRLL
jgi:hypothetical protein